MELTKFDIQYAAIRRSIIEQHFSHLNEMQLEAVLKTEGPLLILAGAGSGKTTVLIQRIINILRFGRGASCEYAPESASQQDLAFLMEYLNNPKPEDKQRAEYLCSVDPAKPWEVIAITFTNKAASEIRERLIQAVGEQQARAIWAHTFHTACLRILRRDIERLGYDKNFTIYDEDDKKRVITDILKRMKLDEHMFDPRAVMSAISRAKDNLITPKKYATDAQDDLYKGKIAEIYALYQKELKLASALDFDDIIMKTVQLLQQNEDILTYYQQKFRYVLVDEYQDTNHAQYVLTSLLAGGQQNLCVVGDDDQSIYKFRGATITNILEFESQYQNAHTIRLEQNYRSTDTILCAANEIIRHNQNRKGKELWTQQGGGEKIKLHHSDSQETEAAYIADCILNGLSQGKHWSDFAVLYRNNVLSNNIEAAFRRHAIPYRIYKGRDFFSRAEIRDMFAYLWVIENPSDTLRLKRIINVPPRKIGERSIEIAEEIAAANNMDLYEVIQKAGDFSELSRAAKAMSQFAQMMDNLRQQQEYLSLPELYDELLEKSGYLAALEAKKNLESRGRAENIMELKSNLVDYQERAETPTLSAFLEEMALFTDSDHTDANEDAVLLMTMHSAKGLEFPQVFLCGMEDGLFPSYRYEEHSEEMEEERRLCYVAVTRAKEQLYITFARQRMIYGRTQYNKPSRFIEEIPADLVDSNISVHQSEPEIIKAGFPQKAAYPGVYRTAAEIEKQQAMAQGDVHSAFQAGDRVQHKVFGVGMVVSAKPLGADLLLEIAFDTKGTKRLLAKSAMQFIRKL